MDRNPIDKKKGLSSIPVAPQGNVFVEAVTDEINDPVDASETGIFFCPFEQKRLVAPPNGDGL